MPILFLKPIPMNAESEGSEIFYPKSFYNPKQNQSITEIFSAKTLKLKDFKNKFIVFILENNLQVTTFFLSLLL